VKALPKAMRIFSGSRHGLQIVESDLCIIEKYAPVLGNKAWGLTSLELADMVNRRKILCIMNLWLAGAAVLLVILGSFQLLNPYVLLFCVFLIGVGFAFHAPAWSAIVPDLVTDEELTSAATLGGLQLNVSGIIGPALGGVLLYFLGASWVFAVNVLCFVVVIFALLQWKGPEAESGFRAFPGCRGACRCWMDTFRF
jgi:MFS family permease